ncbi:MAG: hypothetical protein QM704_19425 [Anaeromyxobacteraceae bacterium]
MLTACGGSVDRPKVSEEAMARAYSAPDPACGPGAPPHRFVPHSSGVPGQWIVVLNGGSAEAVAPALVQEYGGKVIATWTVITGFAVSGLSRDDALLMSIDPRVCWVEQDGYVSGDF